MISYRTAARSLIGFTSPLLLLMLIFRRRILGPHMELRPFTLSQLPLLSAVLLEVTYVASVFALLLAPVFVWAEYRLFRLQPSPRDARPLVIDAVSVVLYVVWCFVFWEMW